LEEFGATEILCFIKRNMNGPPPPSPPPSEGEGKGERIDSVYSADLSMISILKQEGFRALNPEEETLPEPSNGID
jgi:hypothetical protein